MLGFASTLAVVEKELRSSFVTDAVRHVTGSLIKGEGLRFAIVSSLFPFAKSLHLFSGFVLSSDKIRFFLSFKVVARFNEVVTKLLLEGAIETFKKYSVREEDIQVSSFFCLKLSFSDGTEADGILFNQVIWVPGSFEIGVVAQRLGKSGNFHAVLCIGAVV